MKTQKTDETLTINLTGHIDSANASEIESQIDNEISTQGCKALVFDLDGLTYISSAGLRIFLRKRKDFADLKLINVSSEVYEILEMTGFTEMLTVEKAYRNLSIDGCEVIGQGSNGKVYRLDRDTIVKVYFNHDALPDIHRERELARKALILGIPTAISYDVAKIGDLYGSVFELLNAKSFGKLMVEDPDNVDKYIEMDVDLLKKIHSTEVKPDDMPNMKDVAVSWAEYLHDYLPSECYEKLVSMIKAVPEDLHMMHGDYHIKNVMLQDGEVLLIDMDTLCYGDPVFEFASIFNAYVGFAELDHDHVKEFLGIDWDLSNRIWNETLRLYLGTEDKAVLDSYAAKAKIIGYTRIMRRTIKRIGFDDPKGKAIIENCKKHLIELIPTVDSLSYKK